MLLRIGSPNLVRFFLHNWQSSCCIVLGVVICCLRHVLVVLGVVGLSPELLVRIFWLMLPWYVIVIGTVIHKLLEARAQQCDVVGWCRWLRMTFAFGILMGCVVLRDVGSSPEMLVKVSDFVVDSSVIICWRFHSKIRSLDPTMWCWRIIRVLHDGILGSGSDEMRCSGPCMVAGFDVGPHSWMLRACMFDNFSFLRLRRPLGGHWHGWWQLESKWQWIKCTKLAA